MYGDFNFKCEFNTGIKTQVKFYFWLNVSALLYNEELRKLTDVRDKYREEMFLLSNTINTYSRCSERMG